MLSLGRRSIQTLNPFPKGEHPAASLGFTGGSLDSLKLQELREPSLYPLPASASALGSPGGAPGPPERAGDSPKPRAGGGGVRSSIPATAGTGTALPKIGSEAQPAASVQRERKPKGNYSSSALTFSSYSFSEPKEMAVALCGS